MVWGAASEGSRRRSLEASAPLGAAVERIVADAQANGDLPASVRLPPSALTLGPWTLCLGMHTLAQVEGVLVQHGITDPYRLLIQHLHYLLNGYGWQPLFDPADDAAIDAQIERVCQAVFGSTCPRSSQTSTFPETSHG